MRLQKQALPYKLYRYVSLEVGLFFIGCLVAFVGILLAVNLLKFASLIVAKGVAFSQIVMVFASLIPTFLEISIPMSALLGVMLAFARLSGDSELIVIRASGISLLSLIIPVALFGSVITAGTLYVSYIGRPWGYNSLNQTLYAIAADTSTAGIDEGVFSKLGDLTLYTEKLDHETGKMTHVLLDDRRDPLDRKIVFAKTGSISSNPQTKQMYINLEDGEIHQENLGKYAVTHFQKNVSAIDSNELLGKDAQKKGKQLSAMDLTELAKSTDAYMNLQQKLSSGEKVTPDSVGLPYGQTLSDFQINTKEIHKRLNRIAIEEGRRLSMPFAVLMLSFVGMSLGIQPPRTQKTFGLGLSAVFGLSVFVIYYGILSIGIALAESGSIAPLFALWLPNCIVLSLAIFSLYKLGTEQWNAITDILG